MQPNEKQGPEPARDQAHPAKVVPMGDEQRIGARYPIMIDMLVRILFPEETFTPVQLEGESLNMSCNGMKIRVRNLPESIYLNVLKGVRYARVTFPDLREDKNIQLMGRIVWVDYHDAQTSIGNRPCLLGIHFNEGENPDLAHYTAWMEHQISKHRK